MSGHSKWSQIKRQKGAADAKRGQLFTKLGRELTVSAREGGGDPDGNPRLRLAIQRAREANMPMETIDRAVKRGAGGAEGLSLEEIVYEGYGPGGVAILIEALTDNRNRSVAEIRNALSRGGGNLGGCRRGGGGDLGGGCHGRRLLAIPGAPGGGRLGSEDRFLL